MSNINDLEIYDRIIFPKALEIAKRSRLYFLEPIGVGTPYTESLSSYLTRLAQEHCVTPKKLIMGEIAPLIIGDNYHSEMISKNVSTIFGNSDAKPAINGMRDMTGSLVDALENLTLRQDLKFLSGLTWKGIIKERGLFRQNKAWCPQCFEQWRIEKKPIYEPLLWSFKDVNFCPQHHCQLCAPRSGSLRDRCPHCDSSSKAIDNFLVLGYCSRCKHWLGNNSNNTKTTSQDNLAENHYIAISIGNLISLAPQFNIRPNLKDLTRKFQMILFCFERAIRNDLSQYIVLIKIIEKLKIALKKNYNKPMNLTKLVIPVCERAKISISQLFKNDYDSLSKTLSQNFEIDYNILSL